MAELEAEVLYFRSPPLEARLMCYDLPSATTEEELTGIFSAFGSLHSLDVVSQCAFVNFHSARAARRAVAELGSRHGRHQARHYSRAPVLHGTPLEVRPRRKEVSGWGGSLSDWLLPTQA